jgi:preprotein translocase subunit SecD
MWKIRLVALLLLLAGGAVGYFSYATVGTPHLPAKLAGVTLPFKLGLDLNGGTHLEYRADISGISPSEVKDSMNSLREVIERRVNLFGVSEPLVQVEEAGLVGATPDERLIVELPGITDTARAVELIGKTPILEFKTLKVGAENLIKNAGTSTVISPSDIFAPTELTGRFLDHAQLEFDSQTSQPRVSLIFNTEGSALFAKITRENIGRAVAIYLDGVVISTPVVREEITGGKAEISGNFTPESAKELVRNLNYGALPVKIELVRTQTIGASLGADALKKDVRAGMFGFIFVAIFLVLWYRLPGILAIISLSMYTAIMLTLFKLIPVTLTAAGIAGLILSIGMAVDANILIFERMKEEFAKGRGTHDGIIEGFKRAWLSIRDSNISSIITALILFWFGTSSLIKGFALVFGLGVIVSMFTAISVSRTFLLSLGNAKQQGVIKVLFGNGLSK